MTNECSKCGEGLIPLWDKGVPEDKIIGDYCPNCVKESELEESFIKKIRNEKVDKLTLKEINCFINNNWLLWTMKFELSPCGQLTLTGKRQYIENNIEEINEVINFLDNERKVKQ